jgi:chromosomal replication initiation ATPase DnaA
MSQLALDLAGEPAFTAEDFLISPCNAAAQGWVVRWPAWPAFALALSGPAGSGKTHLAHIFAARSGSLILAAGDLSQDSVADLAESDGVVVEDADLGVDETALFHLFNLLREMHRPLLLTGRLPPARWKFTLPDLRSRLASLPLASIGAPDDALLESVLIKLFADRQLRIGLEVVNYILPRMERSFAAARGLVEALDRAALEGGRAVTVPLVRTIIGEGDS